MPGYGWVSFEPTPSFNLPEPSKRYFAGSSLIRYFENRMEDVIQTSPANWWTEIMQAIHGFYTYIKTVLKEFLLMIKSIVENIWSWVRGVGLIVIIAFVIIAGLIYWLFRLFKPFYKKWELRYNQMKLLRLRDNDPERFILRCYLEMGNIFALRGLSRPSYYTPLEYKSSLKARFKGVSHEIDTNTTLFQQAKYSPFPVSADDAESAYKAYEDILKFCFSQK